MKEKDEKSELEGIEKEFEKAALAPRNTFPSKYNEMHVLHDFVTENRTESEFFWSRLGAAIKCPKCCANTHGSTPEQRAKARSKK